MFKLIFVTCFGLLVLSLLISARTVRESPLTNPHPEDPQANDVRPDIEGDKRNLVPDLISSSGGRDSSDENPGEQRRQVVYYNFEGMRSLTSTTVHDMSGYENDAHVQPGGLIVKMPGSSCLNAAYLWCTEIRMHGETFQGKPSTGITVAAWVLLMESDGSHSIFDTIGVSHSLGQYHFEVNNDMLRWFHRNERQEEVFNTVSHFVGIKYWTHVAGTYNSSSGIAQIFINGMVMNRTYGQGKLSKDWGVRAGISNKAIGRPLQGFLDEFRIYNYPLNLGEVRQLMSKCNFSQNGPYFRWADQSRTADTQDGFQGNADPGHHSGGAVLGDAVGSVNPGGVVQNTMGRTRHINRGDDLGDLDDFNLQFDSSLDKDNSFSAANKADAEKKSAVPHP